MINLSYNSAYQYSKEERAQLKALRKKYGKRYQNPYGASKKMVWYDGEVKTTSIKNNISRNLLFNTRFRCSFCGKRLESSSKPIDHFIPNKAYPKYSFHPLNLLSSCSYCNSDSKGEFDPIVTIHKKYNRIKFSIVHPIIDDISLHFKYQTDEEINFDLKNCSIEAIKLIGLLNWTTLEHQINRSCQKTLEIFHPLTDKDLIQLVNECSTYQRKKK